MTRFLCFIGWHHFSWPLPKSGVIDMNSPPPNHATCIHCGVRYRKRSNTTTPEGGEV